MILYLVLLYVYACQSQEVTRLEAGDHIKGKSWCNSCICPASHTTYYNLRGDEQCINANGIGCFLKVDGYTTDVPLITHSMINKTDFRITKDGGNLCPTMFGTYEASSVRMLALTDRWENFQTFMSNLSSYSIPNVKEVS
ncbi:uncharacterized protein LOC130627828 [Hydractinia symbiolongicarpus]|uniref:uncharacterized protein LOC130627828 n=1 Tax=Hydractinia symbiolongicarpus TaxID=13093 RepID=UPI0025505082|nr:uncharacterized protein LOC130627828 [Hydractinia symbiolongicarpus]